jgi:hypothetical protein
MSDDEPPIDPLLIEAREVLASINRARNCHEESVFVKGYLEGVFDDHDDIEIALAALRRGIEIGKQP